VLKLLRGRNQQSASVGGRLPRVPDDLAGLVDGWRRGEAGAAATLLAALGPPMLQMVRRVLGSTDIEVEDVFQEAMLAVARALPTFRGECSTRHFGCRVATLTALKARRRRIGARQVFAPGRAESEAEGRWEGIDETDWVLSSCRRKVVRELLDELPAEQAEALTLHYLAGMTVDEVAAATGVPAETVRSRLRLGKVSLRARAALDPSMSELLEDKL
jgi:RNA polymerase sigma-70 factor (ECF subfamily)